MAKTFAQQAKAITNKYKLRLGDNFDKGDPLALAAMNAELTELQEQQEQVRQVEFEAENADKIGAIQQFANGGKLSKKQQVTLSDILAKSLPEYHAGGGLPHDHGLEGGASLGTADPSSYIWGGGAPPPPIQTGLLPQETNLGSPVGSPLSPGSNFEPVDTKVPWLGPAADMIGGILANRKIDLPTYEYDEWKPERARANLVDYSRGREQTMRERDQAQALITRSARGTGSQAGLMENILTGATGTQRVAGEQFGASLEQEGNINAQIRNQVSQFNAAQAAQAAQLNTRNKIYSMEMERENAMIADTRRANQIGAITGSISGYMGDLQQAGQYDDMLDMLKPENYIYEQEKLTPLQKFLQMNSKRRMGYDPNSRRNTAT